MTVCAHHDFTDYVLIYVEVHDCRTGFNWLVQIPGTDETVHYQWHRAEQLLATAGFSLGWQSHGVYRGTVDHLVMVKEAVDRCWLQHAADLVA